MVGQRMLLPSASSPCLMLIFHWTYMRLSNFYSYRNNCSSSTPKKNNRFYSKLVSIAVVLPFAFAFSITGLLVWRKARQKTFDQDHCLKDPEFTGFHLVCTKSPYIDSPDTCCILPDEIAKAAHKARLALNNRLEESDIIVASYPKSGTTWLSEVVFLLITELDWSAAASANLEERVPYLEYIWPGPEEVLLRHSPRILKTHLPFTHLPQEVQMGHSARVIYITRDPRDIVVSYYHFAKSFIPAGYRNQEGIEGFADRFLRDCLPYSPWSNHVHGYSAAFNMQENFSTANKKFLVVRYEDMLDNPTAVTRRIETFLRDSSPNSHLSHHTLTDSEMNNLVDYCSFEKMSRNPASNFTWLRDLGLWRDHSKFMRHGHVGDHKHALSSAQNDAIGLMAIQTGLDWTLST